MKKLFRLLSAAVLVVALNATALEKPETADINAETASLARDYNAQPMYTQIKRDLANTWNEAKERAKELRERARSKYHEYKAQLYEKNPEAIKERAKAKYHEIKAQTYGTAK